MIEFGDCLEKCPSVCQIKKKNLPRYLSQFVVQSVFCRFPQIRILFIRVFQSDPPTKTVPNFRHGTREAPEFWNVIFQNLYIFHFPPLILPEDKNTLPRFSPTSPSGSSTPKIRPWLDVAHGHGSPYFVWASVDKAKLLLKIVLWESVGWPNFPPGDLHQHGPQLCSVQIFSRKTLLACTWDSFHMRVGVIGVGEFSWKTSIWVLKAPPSQQ